jgi:PIN domain nuclease of toxin-antitoxin system
MPSQFRRKTHLHAVEVYDMPSHHFDPFDRLIIAQAMAEEMTVPRTAFLKNIRSM